MRRRLRKIVRLRRLRRLRAGVELRRRNVGRRGKVGAGIAVSVLAVTACALAYWSAPGSGSASGSVGVLAAPSISSATPGQGVVALSWTSVTAPESGEVTYYVSRDGGAPGASCPSSSSPSAATSCTDTGVSAGSHSYTVTVVWRSWTASSEPVSVEVASAVATHLVLSAASTSPTAGAGDNLTITAENASNETVTGYAGTKNLTFGGAATIGAHQPTVSDSSGTAVDFGSSTAITFTNGVAGVSGADNGVMTLYKAETAGITVSDGTIDNGGDLSVTVSPAAAASFAVPTATTQTAGVAFNETLTAKDAYGNTATGYAGSKTISFSGPSSSPNSTAPSYPASVSFSSGVGTVSITLYKAESTTLMAKEGSISGSSSSFNVSPAAAASLTLSAASTTPTAGTTDNLTITALDAYGNTASAYSGAKILTFGGASTIGANHPTVTSSSGTATNFGTATSISFASGVASVSGANNGVMTLYAAETAKVTVSDGSINNGAGLSVTVSPAALASLALTTPATQTAGTVFNLGMTAKDTYGNGVSGSQALTFSGPASSPNNTAPSYPSSVTFTNGSGTASVTLFDAQSTTLTAKEGAISGTSGSFTVNAKATTTQLGVATPATQTAGTAFSETLTAQETFGNTTTGYTGSKTITFSGPANSPSDEAPKYPATVTFTAGVGGASITLYNAASTTLTAKEGSLSGSSGSFTVKAAGANSFTVPTPGAQTAGTAFSETLTAKDLYGNTATGYEGPKTIAFSGPVSSPAGEAPKYPATVAFSSGVGSASITLYNAASTALTAKEATISGTSGSFTVNAAAASIMAFVNCSLPAGNTTCSGQPIAMGNNSNMTFNMQTQDTFGNPAAPASPLSITFTNSETKQFSITAGEPATITSPATTSGQVTLRHGSNGETDTLTAKASGFANATLTAKK